MSGVPDYPRREKAFNYYAQCHNLSKTSKELKIPIQTLTYWKKSEKWDEKLTLLKDKLRSQHEILKRAEDNFTLESDLGKIKLIELLEDEVAKAISEKSVHIEHWRDVVTTLEFTHKERRLLMGEPTEREVNSIEISGMNEADLDKHIEELKKFVGNAD